MWGGRRGERYGEIAEMTPLIGMDVYPETQLGEFTTQT